MTQNNEHFDLSESKREDLNDGTNKKKLGQMTDELNSLVMIDILALNPKVHVINHQSKTEFEEMEIKHKRTCNSVSKVVIKKEITHKDYVTVLEISEVIQMKWLS